MKKLLSALGFFLLGCIPLIGSTVQLKATDAENSSQTSEEPFKTGYYRFYNSASTDAVKKVMVATPGYVSWVNVADTPDSTSIWRVIDRQDGSFLLKNIATDEYVSGSYQGYQIITDPDSTGQEVFIHDLGDGSFSIKHYQTDYLHAPILDNEKVGSTGVVVSWNDEKAVGCRWYVESLPEDSVLQVERNRTLSLLLEEAQSKYAIGNVWDIDTDNPLLTQKSQILSNAAQVSNDEYTNSRGAWGSRLDGMGYAALVDNDASTYFHSAWEGTISERHHLDFDLQTPQSMVSIVYCKRQENDKNFPVSFNIYGAEASADTVVASNWKLIKTFENQPSDQDSVWINGLELGAQYQYLRFEVTKTRLADMQLNGYPYFALSGIQIYPTGLKSTCFNAANPDAAQSFRSAIEKANRIWQQGTVTQTDIDDLQQAIDTYLEHLGGDPTELRELVNSARELLDGAIVVDSETDLNGLTVYPDPGTYKASDKKYLENICQLVETYLTSIADLGMFDKVLINTYKEQLLNGMEEFKKKARPFKYADAQSEGVWYEISTAKRYFYANSKANKADMRNGVIYVKNTEFPYESLLGFAPVDSLQKWGIDRKYAQWRFVQVTDSTYAIQNRATHLYIDNYAVGGWRDITQLSASPIAFKISDIGYGSFIFHSEDLHDGYQYLNSEVATNNVVFWYASTLGSGSTWEICNTEEARTSEEGEAVTDFGTADIALKGVQVGRYYTFCFPVAIDSIYDLSSPDVQSAYRISHKTEEGIWLSRITGPIPAGEPFIYLAGNDAGRYTSDPTAADTTTIHICLGDIRNIEDQPKSVNGLVGVFGRGSFYNAPENPDYGKISPYYSKGQKRFIETIEATDTCEYDGAYIFLPDVPISGTGEKYIYFQDYLIRKEATDEARAELRKNLEKAAAYVPYIGTGAGKYDSPDFNTTYNWGTVLVDQEDAILADLRSANTQLLEVLGALQLNEVPTGRFYRIRNCKTGSYILSDANTSPLKLMSDDAGSNIASTLFYLSDNGHLTGSLMLNLSGNAFDSQSLGDVFTCTPSGVDRTYTIKNDKGQLLAAESDRLSALEAASTDTAACWYLEEVTDADQTPFHRIAMSTYMDKSYATVYAPVALKIPAGVVAYTVEISGEKALLTPLEGDVIPAGTGVVLEGSKSGVIFLEYASGTSESPESDLEGVFVNTPVAGRYLYYTLQTVNGQLGFFQYGGTTLNAYKSYLRLSPGQNVRGFVLGDGATTGIEGVMNAESGEKVIYDVSGRRLQSITQPGIYIINGEKVVIK